VARLAADPEERAAMGRRGAEAARAGFSWAARARDTAELLLPLSRGRARARQPARV
jgi:glycosyltransferase involved in cell wall biosynthesis